MFARPALHRVASGAPDAPPPSRRMRPGAWLLLAVPAGLLACAGAASPRAEQLSRERDELSALWSLYRYTHLWDGRVVELDEGGVTTSEGQAYAMLRAVWANDRETFEAVWGWTK